MSDVAAPLSSDFIQDLNGCNVKLTWPNSKPPHKRWAYFRSVICPSGSESLPPSRWLRRSCVRIVSLCSCQESMRPTPPTDPGPSPRLSWGGPVCCCVLWTTRRAMPSTCSQTAAPTFCWTPWLVWDTGRCCVWAHPGEGATEFDVCTYQNVCLNYGGPSCLKGSVHPDLFSYHQLYLAMNVLIHLYFMLSVL